MSTDQATATRTFRAWLLHGHGPDPVTRAKHFPRRHHSALSRLGMQKALRNECRRQNLDEGARQRARYLQDWLDGRTT